MKLHELHVLDRSLGPVNHRDAVARGDVRVGRGGIHGSRSACCHQGDAAQEGVYLMGIGVQDVCAVALDVGSLAGHLDAQMVLCDDFNGEMVFQHGNVLVGSHGSHQSSLNLKARVILVVQYPEFAVSALPMQVVLAFWRLVEVDSPLHQVVDGLGGVAHNMFNRLAVGYEIACDHRVLDVFFEVVYLQISHRGDTSLCLGRVGLVQGSLANQGNFTFSTVSNFECKAHACHSTPYYQEIKFSYHDVLCYVNKPIHAKIMKKNHTCNLGCKKRKRETAASLPTVLFMSFRTFSWPKPYLLPPP